MRFFIERINRISVLVVLSCVVSAFGDEYVIPWRELENLGGAAFSYYQKHHVMPQDANDLNATLRQRGVQMFDIYEEFGYDIGVDRKSDDHIVITLYDGIDMYKLDYIVSDKHCFFMLKNGRKFRDYKHNEDGRIYDYVYYSDSRPYTDEELLPFF